MKLRYGTALLAVGLILWSCNKDDNNDPEIELRDRAEVAAESDAALREYLSTHFYNYEEFENPAEGFDYKIVFDTIAGENANKIPLINQVSVKEIEVDEVTEKLYYLVIREGVGTAMKWGHSVVTNYEGSLLNGEVFDRSLREAQFITVRNDVAALSIIRGFGELMTFMKTGSGFVDNPDGTLTWNQDYGLGATFIPAGLAYFNSTGSSGALPAYAPLIFKVGLYHVNDVDDDFRNSSNGFLKFPDGIPTHLEDVDGDGLPINDDTDGDRLPNYLDEDDDGDGILTKFEYDRDGDGVVDDSNGDGTPDYLDPEYPKVGS